MRLEIFFIFAGINTPHISFLLIGGNTLAVVKYNVRFVFGVFV